MVEHTPAELFHPEPFQCSADLVENHPVNLQDYKSRKKDFIRRVHSNVKLDGNIQVCLA